MLILFLIDFDVLL